MKRIFSAFLSLVMLIGITAGIDLSAYASSTVYETENNDYFSSANLITIGNVIKGSSSRSDADFFKFEVTKGGKISFAVESYVDRSQKSDSIIKLYDSNYEEAEDGTNHLIFYNENLGYGAETYEFMIQPGTYYLRMYVYQSEKANYSIKNNLKPSNQTYSGRNDYSTDAFSVPLGKTIYGQADTYFSSFDRGSWDRNYDWYKFVLPSSGKISIKYSMNRNAYGHRVFTVQLFKNVQDDDILRQYNDSRETKVERTITANLSKGTYYIAIASDPRDMITYSFNIGYTITAPSSLNVSSRSTSALKLSWSGVSGASGYQLQHKSGNSWKTNTTTSSTSYAVKGLSAGSAYQFRVRAYKKINGKSYYSSWRYLTACAKPATVKLSKISAQSGHKLKASWKKASGSASGYQIYWAKEKNFKKVVAKTNVSGQKKTSYTGKNFTKGRKYYVKIRAYKTVDGKKYYGSWSNIKSVKAK